MGTALVLGVLVVIVALIIAKMVRDNKNGKTSCGCGCSGCPSEKICHKK